MEDCRQLLKTTGGRERMRAHGPKMDPARIAALHVEKTAIYGEILARAAGLKIAVATTTNLPNVEALANAVGGVRRTRFST